MKKISVFCLLLVCIGFVSCKKEEKQKAKLPAEKPISVACYEALFEKDTIELRMNTLKSGKITGNMVMKIFNMPENVGEIIGEFHGDTLFADYSFVKGKNGKEIFKNPIAILKKGDELVLGNGKIETYLGASYFDKKTPIDFDRVKYKFKNVNCVEK